MDNGMIGAKIDGARMQANIAANEAKAKSAGISKKNASHAQIEKTAEDFEAVFLSQMLEHMFAGVDMDPMNEGAGEDTYKSMLVDEYAKILARSGGIGVADHVKREMLKIQEGATP